jgi:hypothetical protein
MRKRLSLLVVAIAFVAAAPVTASAALASASTPRCSDTFRLHAGSFGQYVRDLQ